MTAPTLVAARTALPPDAVMLSSPAATGDPWIPACAGMTTQGTGMPRQGAEMMGRDGVMNHV